MEGNFIQVPTVVILDPRMENPNCFRLYCILLSYAYQRNMCFPGQRKIASLLGVSVRSVITFTQALRDLGLISIERRGLKETNRYWIEDVGHVYSLKRMGRILRKARHLSDVQLASLLDVKPTSLQDVKPTSHKEEEDEDEEQDVSRDARQSVFVDLAKQLSSTVGKVRKLPTTATPVKWGWPIERLHRVEGVPIERIKHAMEWYCSQLLKEGDINSNGNPSFLPVAYSGKAFAAKFEKIEGAMGRRGVRLRMTPKKNLTYDQVEAITANRCPFPQSDPRFKKEFRKALEQAGNPPKVR